MVSIVDEVLGILHRAHVDLGPGLSETQLAKVERRFGIRFNPDHADLLKRAVPRGKGWVDWLGDPDIIRGRLDWPLEGVLFDVEKNAFWPASRGERPPSRTAAVAVAKQKFADVPVLVPFFVHRFLPASPAASGSPLFSVYQTDVICYGNNLAEYRATEFLSEARRTIGETRLRVEFWSDLAEGGDFTVLW